MFVYVHELSVRIRWFSGKFLLTTLESALPSLLQGSTWHRNRVKSGNRRRTDAKPTPEEGKARRIRGRGPGGLCLIRPSQFQENCPQISQREFSPQMFFGRVSRRLLPSVTIVGARYDWTTGVPDNGNDWRKFRAVPRLHPLRPLVCTSLIGVETEALLDYQGRAGDHFHCAVEPSPGHIRCRTIDLQTFRKKTKGQQLKGKIVSEFFTFFTLFGTFSEFFPPGLST